MKISKEKKKFLKIAAFCIASFIAGGVNGFMGTGGGIIFVYALRYFTDNEEKDNFATTLCAILPLSAISIWIYAKNSNIDFEMIKKLTLPAIFGGALGAFLTDKIKKKYLSLAFSALVIYSGMCMILR
ncbi:MAG: sulfite exporter TauE/SafE family protein [Clostridia bacterium]|nr:sulfite exporter TauE/SafE family protein [Clostridia bacterium]